MIRTIKRWFSTEEVKLLSKEVEAMIDRHADYGHKLEGITMKLERMENKFRMRESRAVRGGQTTGLSEEEQAIVDDLRSGALPFPQRGPQDPF